MKFFAKMIRDTKAATAIEYGLIAALIAVAGITAFQSVGSEISSSFNATGDCLETAQTGAAC